MELKFNSVVQSCKKTKKNLNRSWNSIFNVVGKRNGNGIPNSLFRWCRQTKNETGSLNFVFPHRGKTVDTKEHACPQYGKLICANPNARTSERLQKPNP